MASNNTYAFGIRNVSKLAIKLSIPSPIEILPGQKVDLIAAGADVFFLSRNSALFHYLDTGRLIVYTVPRKTNYTAEQIRLNDTRFTSLESSVSNGHNKYGYSVDDIRVPLTASTAFGSNPMSFARFRSQAGTTIGQALAFDGTTGSFGYIEDSGALLDFTQSWSTSMWVVIDSNQPGLSKGVMEKNGTFYIRPNVGSSTLTVRITGGGSGLPGSFTSSIQYLPDQKNHIVLTAEISGAGPYVATYTLYINGVEAGSMAVTPASIGNTTADIAYSQRNSGGRQMKGQFDDIRWYNTVLDLEDDILPLYAGGQGTHNIVEAAQGNLVLHHKLDEFDTSGDPIVSEATPPVANYEFKFAVGAATIVSGLVTEAASRGVFVYKAAPNQEQEVHFSCQMSHSYINGTPYEPHVHFMLNDDSSPVGTVIFGLEYAVTSAFGGIFPETQILTVEYDLSNLSPFQTQIASFGAVDGTGLDSSFQLIGRLFRDGNNDTYQDSISIAEFDIHYAKRGVGDDFDSVPPWDTNVLE